MTNLFLGFLNRSLSAAVLIFAVVRAVGAGGGAAFVPVLD